jgi:3-oxoacyl-[acyl-carrier protein] reductase
VRNEKACGAFVDEVTRKLGPVLILVNNAGITRDMLLMRMKEQDWVDVVDTDLSSVYRMCKAVIRGMYKERYGRIISIGSVVGSMGNFGQANYAAAKAGLIGMSKALAAEVGTRDITVNVVAPGFIETDMTKDLDENIRKKLFERILIPRFGKPEEVAAAVAFLASKEAGYITGNTLHINGGLQMI